MGSIPGCGASGTMQLAGPLKRQPFVTPLRRQNRPDLRLHHRGSGSFV